MDVFDGRFLREFLCVVQEGSIRRASEELNVVPSAISRRLSDAEIRLGVKLFERHSQGMELTDVGRILFEHATHLREEQDYIRDLLGEYRGDTQRVVKIGAGEGYSADLMQNGLSGLKEMYPKLRYAITMRSTEDLMDLVALGKIDVAVAYSPVLRSGMRSLAIGRQPLCAVIPNESPLAGKSSVSLEEVLAQPYGLMERGHAIRRLVDHAASDKGLAVAPLVECDSIVMLIRFVTAGLGLTFLPRFSAAIQEARGELKTIDIAEPLLTAASSHIVVRSRRRLPKSVQAVATFLSSRMAAFNS